MCQLQTNEWMKALSVNGGKNVSRNEDVWNGNAPPCNMRATFVQPLCNVCAT